MKKIVWTYGLIAGGITAVALIAGMVLMVGPDGKMDLDRGAIFGYTAMIVALSLIFFGIRSYRDKYLDGNISFGKALKTGLLITAVASVMYVFTWMVYYYTTDISEEFGIQYTEHLAEKMRAKGAPEQDIAAKMKEDEDFIKLYDSNPLVMFGVTLLEIFPVGLLISLISSFFLKHKVVRE